MIGLLRRRFYAAVLGLILATPLVAAPALALDWKPWMHADVAEAWSQGFAGQRARITVIDDFRSQQVMQGYMRGGVETGRHGDWTARQTRMVAPAAKLRRHDFGNRRAVGLARGLNVINLSYGMFGPARSGPIRWDARERSIIAHARSGRAVVAKAAGNDGIAVGSVTALGTVDHLARALIGARSAIFVGALERHGSVEAPARLAAYSNVAGPNRKVQARFLVAGVPGQAMGLQGTSFAAPVVSGYAAILGSKFRKAKPAQLATQLLRTARTDTVAGYEPAIHGRGEVSLSRALAPARIR